MSLQLGTKERGQRDTKRNKKNSLSDQEEMNEISTLKSGMQIKWLCCMLVYE
jgi:hypothetical protein